jgi:hypothetical protein
MTPLNITYIPTLDKSCLSIKFGGFFSGSQAFDDTNQYTIKIAIYYVQLHITD